MLFNSPEFIFAFLPLALVVYWGWLRSGHARAATASLVCASLVFYGWWDARYLVLLATSVLVNFAWGSWLGRTPPGRGRTVRLALGVAFNLGLLGYFKYASFAVANLEAAFAFGWQIEKIVLPLAISFFTFQQIAFLVDASRGLAREYDFLQYALFVTFFPQLIAGPIVHHSEMMPQFAARERRRGIANDLTVGLVIFAIGLFKKVVLADNVAGYASSVFALADMGMPVGFFAGWQATLAYTAQIYFDFSGYSDMAIGLGRMFGIVLPLNFASPYKAQNAIEFWRRWHMTLSRFLRDYLYFPLGGNRRGSMRRYLNLGVVMLLGGLWHGAGWNFVIWGALHGVYLMANHGWRALRGPVEPTRFARLASHALTLLAIVVAWAFFRAETLDGALRVLHGMAGLSGFETPRALADLQATIGWPVFDRVAYRDAFRPAGLGVALAFVALALTAPNTQQILRRYEPALERADEPGRLARWIVWRPTRLTSVLTGAVALCALLSLWRISEFLYFQF